MNANAFLGGMMPVKFLYMLAMLGLALNSIIAMASCQIQAGVKHVYYGDLHDHTGYSFDAYGLGTRVDPNDAYSFAKKQKTIVLPSGFVAEIEAPLDFLAVTDHSEYLGFVDLCTNQASPLYKNPRCVEFRLLAKPGIGLTTLEAIPGLLPNPQPPALCQKNPQACQTSQKTVWQKIIDAANKANDTQNCTFTAFVASEWSNTPLGATMHRNHIYRNDKVPALPIDSFNYASTSDMWNALDKQCTNAGIGCDVLAIPHNGNLSNGMTYDLSQDSSSDKQLRAKYEKLIEIHQHKGNSECLNPNQDDTNPDCLFEILLAKLVPGAPVSSKDYAQFRKGYARHGLSNGLENYATLGYNPLQFGFVGATDTHNGTPGNVAENNWPGHIGGEDGTPQDRLNNWSENNPGGITGVWAEVNTRDAIFDALKRRETFATSGPRISLRFGQTFDQTTDYCAGSANFGNLVPMGGTMPPAQIGAKPRFVVQALKAKTNIKAVDIIKASLINGVAVEKVYHLNLGTSQNGYTNVCQTFVDNDFKGEPAYWYARVLEMETPRWSSYDCKALQGKNKNCPKLDVMINERAWSSPIWNLP